MNNKKIKIKKKREAFGCKGTQLGVVRRGRDT
jgi:hypothetical protein